MRSSPHLDAAPRSRIAADDIARGIAGLAGGKRLVVLGIGRDEIGAIVAEGLDGSRSVLLVARDHRGTPEAIVDRLLDDLADLALDLWPRWCGRGEGGAPPIVDPWLEAASKRVGLGRPPRLRRLGREREFARLSRAIDPSGVVLVWEIDPASAARACPVIEALEWCARHGAAAVAGLTAEPPEAAPYDRLLYGARAFSRRDRAAAERFIAPAGAHPASAVERRVADALGRDAELAGLFACNAPVPVGAWGARPRVDLLCRAHRVVVELDGPEHRAEPLFGADRHRDYELLTAGYRVLRLTNAQVAADLPLAIEKIRAVVRLRRREAVDGGRDA